MLVFLVWFTVINQQLNVPTTEYQLTNLAAEQDDTKGNYNSDWQPAFNQPYQEFQFLKQLNNETVDVYIAWYPRGHGELISSMNRLYPEKAWTLESTSTYPLDDGQNMDLAVIVNPYSKRLLSYWYVVDGKVFTNNRMAKLYEIYRILTGSYMGSGLVAISQKTDNTMVQKDQITFAELTNAHLAKLNQYFEFE
jgi:EpsI family protein